MTLGGGTQERLGLYLRSELNCKPSIHCVGAAIAFLSGDQVQIPRWADRMYLGWLFRCLSDPARYMPRYWDARKLLSLMIRYGSSLPDSRKSTLRKCGAGQERLHSHPLPLPRSSVQRPLSSERPSTRAHKRWPCIPAQEDEADVILKWASATMVILSVRPGFHRYAVRIRSFTAIGTSTQVSQLGPGLSPDWLNSAAGTSVLTAGWSARWRAAFLRAWLRSPAPLPGAGNRAPC